MEVEDDRKRFITFWFFKRRSNSKSFSPDEENSAASSTLDTKPQGWKAMPFILGNETFERLGSFGIMANFTVYLLNEYNISQVYAAAKFGAWNGVSNFLTVICAFVADAYIGKFLTIVLGSFASLLGMLMVTLTALVPQLRPPHCSDEQRNHGQCIGPNRNQLAFLHLAMFWLAIGGGGIRPCSIPFAVDQFDSTTNKGRKEITSFFNWYYTSFTIVLLITSTVVAYVQTVNWAWGFVLPSICMFSGLVLLFTGMSIYVLVTPEGSVFSSIAQVCIVAYKKRGLQLPPDGAEADRVLFDPQPKRTVLSKLPLTSQFRFLNKAAIIEENEVTPDGFCINPWRLCSVQQIEEVKCLMNIVPVCASAIISFLPMQIGTFLVGQAMRMDRHLGSKFVIPIPSIGVVTLMVMAIFLPIYDRYLVPTLEKITKQEGGITLLQRIGLGNIFSILAMIVAGFVERKRRASAILHANPNGIAPISVLWLAPQLILMGFFEIFNLLGFIQFYNNEFPDHMRSIGNSLVFLSVSIASYLNSLVVTLVHSSTRKHGRQSWLSDDTNAGKLDYFYFLIAGLGLMNFIYFLFAARRYRYKAS